MVIKVKTEGQSFVKPSEYLRPVAQINSKIPAISKTIQAVVVVTTQPLFIQFYLKVVLKLAGDFYIPSKHRRKQHLDEPSISQTID
jgi:hypothetical protein